MMLIVQPLVLNAAMLSKMVGDAVVRTPLRGARDGFRFDWPTRSRRNEFHREILATRGGG